MGDSFLTRTETVIFPTRTVLGTDYSLFTSKVYGPGSVVGIATGYGEDGPGNEGR